MECPNCGFQNLPGLAACARCAGRLDFDDVDIEPYRASDPWLRRLRRRWGQRRRLYAIRSWMGEGWEELRRAVYSWMAGGSGGRPAGLVRVGWVCASLIPGLGHMLSGRRRKGRWLLTGWLSAIGLALLFMSSAWPVFAALAIGLQVYAIIDCVYYRADYAPRSAIVVSSLVVFGVLLYGYWGAQWVLEGVARFEPVNIDLRGNILQRGDVILVPGRWLTSERYARGDVVLYHTPGQAGHGWYMPAGLLIDRILAGPGDRVAIKEGRMTVNGKPLPANQGFLADVVLSAEDERLVPEGSYFIYPTLVRLNLPAGRSFTDTEFRMNISLVRAEDIRGRVKMIVNPIYRIRRL